MDTCVVLFPGIGYGVDRPLFYYARQQALAHGCRVVCVNYPPFQRDPSVPVEKQAAVLLPACAQSALAQLADIESSRLVFIGKSLGSLVAGETARLMNIDPVSIFLTPVPQTYECYMKGRTCWTVYGTADPLMTPECAERMSRDPAVRRTVVPGANHSLEIPGDVLASVDALRKVVALYCTLF